MPAILHADLNSFFASVEQQNQPGLVGRQFGLTIHGGHASQSGHLTEKVFTDNSREIFEKLYTIYSRWPASPPPIQLIKLGGNWLSADNIS